MSDTCMTWIGGRITGRLCGQPATARRGGRCPGGCLGEGRFEYSCDEHPRAQQIRRATCARCGSEVELFTSQAVAS